MTDKQTGITIDGYKGYYGAILMGKVQNILLLGKVRYSKAAIW